MVSFTAGLEIMGFLVVKNDHNLASKEVVIGDELACVSIHSILPLLSLNNKADLNPGHNTGIGG